MQWGSDLRPKYERSFRCTCAFADSIQQSSSLLDVAPCPHSDRKSSCPPATALYVYVRLCVWACVTGKGTDPQLHDCIYYVELNGSLLPLRHLCEQLWVNPLPGKETAQYCFNSTVNCYPTLPTFRGREADLLCFLNVPTVCRNVVKCLWNGCSTNNAQTHPHFSAENLCLWVQSSESCLQLPSISVAYDLRIQQRGKVTCKWWPSNLQSTPVLSGSIMISVHTNCCHYLEK